jgi:hypothetical protein
MVVASPSMFMFRLDMELTGWESTVSMPLARSLARSLSISHRAKELQEFYDVTDDGGNTRLNEKRGKESQWRT